MMENKLMFWLSTTVTQMTIIYLISQDDSWLVSWQSQAIGWPGVLASKLTLLTANPEKTNVR